MGAMVLRELQSAVGELGTDAASARTVLILCGGCYLARMAAEVVTACLRFTVKQRQRLCDKARIAPRRELLRRRVERASQRVADGLHETGISPDKEKEILQSSAIELAAKMRSGALKVVDVVLVVGKQALAAHAKTNCLTEVLLDDGLPFATPLPARKRVAALAQGPPHAAHPLADNEGALAIARRLDKLPPGERKGSLFGVPMSLKDCVGLRGCDSSLGDPNSAGKAEVDDAVLVSLLRDQGAIMIAKSTVPQTMLSYECESPVFGLTTHPLKQGHSPGGSSGGEACLLSFAGSMAGIGTDIGGSVRMPCHFCGLYGLKPSLGRVPAKGMASGVPGQEAVPGTAGPMARNMADCTELARVVMAGSAAARVDATCLPLQWQEPVYAAVRQQKQLRFGYYDFDGFLAASPACRRAVQEAVAALRAKGHICEPWAPPDMKRVVPLYARLLCSDGSKTINQAAVQAPAVRSLVLKTQIPVALKRIAAWLLRNVLRSPVMAQLTLGMTERTVQEYYAGNWERAEERQEALRRFNQGGFDAVIAPPMPIPAVPHGTFLKAPFGACYTGPWNLLDWAGVSVPVTTVDQGRDADTSTLPVVDEFCHSQFYGGRAGGLLPGKRAYDAAAMHGLPVGVQVLCPRLREEVALACAAVLDEALGTQRELGQVR
eukprot:TRINITY_DN12012_c0_g1_i1.p1 TRINITY_DN12012_c0_g1~~TRINITY_DN12012_c0_g1_i1.p1  ORF type:complete len:662 (+),score=178.48 TRINITY_DN12012_c0_g1_i1:69-2054(+)